MNKLSFLAMERSRHNKWYEITSTRGERVLVSLISHWLSGVMKQVLETIKLHPSIINTQWNITLIQCINSMQFNTEHL